MYTVIIKRHKKTPLKLLKVKNIIDGVAGMLNVLYTNGDSLLMPTDDIIEIEILKQTNAKESK